MGFVVLHMEKAHGSDSGTTAHIERFIIPKNADPTRTHLNRKLVTYPDGIKDRTAAIQKRLEEAGLTRKIGNNQVRAIRINVSGTHEDMKRIEKEGRLDEWCADNMKYFADLFGRENIVAAHLHRDEETPHIHITLVPIVKGERKRKKREEQVKKRYRKKPTNAVRLCADDIMTRLKLKSYQDSYAIAMAKYGLQRGIDGSQARHKSTQQYYRDIQKLADSLKSEVVDLQEQKTEAEQELTGGYHTEYNGTPFAMFYLAEYIALVTNSALATTCFLGGFHAPCIGIAAVDNVLNMVPGLVWFFGKVFFMIWCYMMVRWTFVRPRVDQLMDFEWKFLLPVTLVLLTAGAAWIASSG